MYQRIAESQYDRTSRNVEGSEGSLPPNGSLFSQCYGQTQWSPRAADCCVYLEFDESNKPQNIETL